MLLVLIFQGRRIQNELPAALGPGCDARVDRSLLGVCKGQRASTTLAAIPARRRPGGRTTKEAFRPPSSLPPPPHPAAGRLTLEPQAQDFCFALLETHLPNAFFLFLFVPYFIVERRDARRGRAALGLALLGRVRLVLVLVRSSSSSSSSSSLDFEETHLPKAFFLFLFVPYFSLNAAMLRRGRAALCLACLLGLRFRGRLTDPCPSRPAGPQAPPTRRERARAERRS